jgi:serine/threonine protein kinase
MRTIFLVLGCLVLAHAKILQSEKKVSALTKVHSGQKVNSEAQAKFQKQYPVLNEIFSKVGVHLDPEQGFPAKLTVTANELGRGAFGVVFSGTWSRFFVSDYKVAVKLLIPVQGKTNQQLVDTVKDEATNLELIGDCKFVLQVKTAFVCTKADLPAAIQSVDVFSALANGDQIVGLVTFIANAGKLSEHKDEMSGKQRLQVLEDYAKGLGCLQGKGFVHRDIKPDNLMMEFDGSDPRGVIIDFGLMTTIADATSLCQRGGAGGTLAYMPPEIKPPQPGTAGSDCVNGIKYFDGWSLGKVFEECGCDARAGSDAQALLADMQNIAKSPTDWADIASRFTTGRKDLPAPKLDKFNVDANEDKYRQSTWKLSMQGDGYKKP